MLIVSFMMGCIIPIMQSIDRATSDGPLNDYQSSQTSENPPFEAPASNASTLDSGSNWVNGQEIFWRYFFPNTSVIQPKNFRFSFEIWWKTPDVGIEIVVDLSENEGESNATRSYETLATYEEVLDMPDGDFIQYAIWMNTTYFFANETWASFGNEFIDEESLNLTVGIRHDTYFPLFEYTILRDTVGPSLEIIHPNYNESTSQLVLNWSDTSFQIIVTGLKYIESVTLIATFLNQTTFELDEMIFWTSEDIESGESGAAYIPPLIVEKYVSNSGVADIDTENPIASYFRVIDSLGYETRKRLDIIIDMPYSTTPTTTPSTTGDWDTMIIVGSVSIVGVTAVLIGIRRMRK